MNRDVFSTLTVVRNRDLDGNTDHRHVVLSIRSIEPRAMTDDGEGVAGVDPQSDEDWQALGAIAVELAGILGRIVATVAAALLVTGREHRCGCQVQRWDDEGEIPTAFVSADGCYWDLDIGPLLDDGFLPSVDFYVPRNRERSWHEHLVGHLERIARVDLDALLTTTTT